MDAARPSEISNYFILLLLHVYLANVTALGSIVYYVQMFANNHRLIG